MNRVTTYGFETAIDHTFSYLGRYLMLGGIPIVWTACDSSWPELAGVLVILHVVSVAVLFPGTLAINLLALKLARKRTWDQQPWRAWLSGILGVGLVWGTFLVMTWRNLDPPGIFTRLLGPGFAAFVWVLGAPLMASGAALTVSWLCPPDARKSR